MKKTILFFLIALLTISCSTKKPYISKPMYQVLTGNDYGGASFRFYEIISQADEFNILLSDDILKHYVKKEDIETSNFILVNLGEKKSGGYTVEIVSVEELADKIVVTLKENEPKPGENVSMAVTNPYFVIRINSKKPIEIK